MNIYLPPCVANIVFPLQLILFFPFLKSGENISKVQLDPLSKVQLISTFEEDFFHAIQELSRYLMIACLGWSLAILPIFGILFVCLWAILKNFGPILAQSKVPHKTNDG